MAASQYGRSGHDKNRRRSVQREQDRLAALCQDCGSRLGPRDDDPDYCNRCVGWNKIEKARNA